MAEKTPEERAIDRRIQRILDLTPEQATACLHYLSGYEATGTDMALDHYAPAPALVIPPAALAPPAPDDGPICGARVTEDDRPFGCTAAPGHDGVHVAYGTQDEVCHTWPQEPAVAPFTPPGLVVPDVAQAARILTDEEHANLHAACACHYFLRTDDGLWELSSRKACRLHDVPVPAKHCADCGATGPLDGEGVCQDFAGCAERQTGLARKTAGGAR